MDAGHRFPGAFPGLCIARVILRLRLTAGLPLLAFGSCPSPATVLEGEASYRRTAPGNGLPAVPAAREALDDILNPTEKNPEDR